MLQNLLIPKAGSSCVIQARCPMQCGYLGFRFVRYQCSPWLSLATVPLKLLCASEQERTYAQICYFRALARIDFASMYELLHDLLW